jgi:choline kinase
MDQKKLNSRYTAVLLAAGYGSRISSITSDPKCLLKINGMTLLERNFALWKELGINQINLVLGYKSEAVKQLAMLYETDFTIRYYENSDYLNQGNTHSLALGISEAKGPCLIFDADLIYDASILKNFLEDEAEDQFLIGPSSLADIECAKTLVDLQGFVRKTIDKRAITEEELKIWKFVGETVGILKFSAESVQKMRADVAQFLSVPANSLLNWEHFFNYCLHKYHIGTYFLRNERCIEIDNPQDYAKACAMFEYHK